MVENNNPLFVLSISHKQAPVQIRSQFAFDGNRRRTSLPGCGG